MKPSSNLTEHTMPVSEFLAVRLYSDTRPHLKLIAGLQKGLILVYKGRELVGEGTGFGVPVVRYRNRTYFSSSSIVNFFKEDDYAIAEKQFDLDTIYNLKFRNTNIENRTMRSVARRLSESYEKHKHLRPILQQSWLNRLGMRNAFTQAKSMGTVTIKYQVNSPLVHIEVEVKLVNKGHLEKLCILNEQGSKYLGKYYDSNGEVLLGKRIGAWDYVKANWACITTEGGQVGFRLWKVDNALLCRGREFTTNTYDWVGLDYELEPQTTHFEYDIEVLGSTKKK